MDLDLQLRSECRHHVIRNTNGRYLGYYVVTRISYDSQMTIDAQVSTVPIQGLLN